ncbi:MAG: hypothetical protein JXA37_14120 [Chloroflexia bacterium]|nr:hypothetical protein [Chloroflexia bacterium]
MPGVHTRKILSNKPPLVKRRPTKPSLLDYVDVASGERNTALSPGGRGKLGGQRLR